MKVCWIISEDIPSGLIDPKDIKNTAVSWGSWKTWKEFRPDNCVCSDTNEAKNLIQRAFHAVCTLYIMQESYSVVGNPSGVKLFNGQFKNSSVGNKDDIVALNLAVPQSDIVLMTGFNFSPITETNPSQEEYYFNIRELIKANDTTQFVLVDYTHELASWTRDLDNLTLDTIGSVKNLLG